MNGRGFPMKQTIAKHLLNIGAVSLKPSEPYTWSSGIKSPIYCDNRLTMSYPHVRGAIASSLVTLIHEKFNDVEVIAGTAIAGIPHAAWVSDRMDLPMTYVRSKAKGHGKSNQIEGVIPKGKKVVIVEDLISTGGSVINAAKALTAAGAIVIGVVAIFTYDLEEGYKRLEDEGLSWYALTNFETLVKEAIAVKAVKEEEYVTMLTWRENPSQWGMEG
jgi:orotate phosphoribosyltransferase